VISNSESEQDEPSEVEDSENDYNDKQQTHNAADMDMDDEEFEKQNTERVKEALSRKAQNSAVCFSIRWLSRNY
jgi:hypothetical protein